MGSKGGSSFDYSAYMRQVEEQNQRMMDMMAQMMQANRFEMPTYEAPAAVAEEGPTYEERQAEAERTQGIADRDKLYSDYLDAVDKATQYVNTQIEQERSNAQLIGADYTLTDEEKQKRIGDYFASIWGAGQQQQLEDLFNKWGNPEGFSDWLIVRGDASNVPTQDTNTNATSPVAESKPLQPLTDDSLLEEEEGILGA
jgi:hypothetical protein